MDDKAMAQHRLEHGAEFPYDAPDAWWEMAEPKPLPATDWAHAAARGVLDDLQDRRGIKWSLKDIDEDVRAELVASLALERLIYLGFNFSGNGFWHQFALADEPRKVWAEVATSDLWMIEESGDAAE